MRASNIGNLASAGELKDTWISRSGTIPFSYPSAKPADVTLLTTGVGFEAFWIRRRCGGLTHRQVPDLHH